MAILLPADERLARFRGVTEDTRAALHRDLSKHLWGARRDRPRTIGGGAPTFPTTLAAMRLPFTKNTFTGPNSILDLSCRGPFSPDWFNAPGAQWEMESMGVASTTGTPTVIWRVAMGVASADPLGTSLANTATLTCISGMANISWYFYVIGRTVLAQGSTSTMRVQGLFTQQFVIAAAGNNVAFLPASGTAPTDVTTDISSNVYLDMQATWSASSVSNTITTEHYRLTSVMN